MPSLNDDVREYTTQLRKGQIQRAYRGIMAFMSNLRTYLESKYPDHTTTAVYPGNLDGTYFAFTPAALQKRHLKIAIVFLHEECVFEVWLVGRNRQVQARYSKLLSDKDIGKYTLSQLGPRVDSIIAWRIVEQPDFDQTDELKQKIEVKTIAFVKDMQSLLQYRSQALG